MVNKCKIFRSYRSKAFKRETWRNSSSFTICQNFNFDGDACASISFCSPQSDTHTETLPFHPCIEISNILPHTHTSLLCCRWRVVWLSADFPLCMLAASGKLCFGRKNSLVRHFSSSSRVLTLSLSLSGESRLSTLCINCSDICEKIHCRKMERLFFCCWKFRFAFILFYLMLSCVKITWFSENVSIFLKLYFFYNCARTIGGEGLS